ncbi:hypothetical protein [Neobacillus ginsengisoli]|uniref:Uncharacterized protein n=1 Tax=Neobacillus ginsengisoli TaxID=904295 RepID=A0ABT9XSZ8_9BACI|nr:hypothetical protein [Neobacillus ginsengisoli]MDQ0198680.1 hypothetical protein [Neobacillus ginsengisoli]
MKKGGNILISDHEKDKKNSDYKKEAKNEHSIEPNSDGLKININIQYTFNIGNKNFNIEQRAEGGGQINKHVGTNANQGGQNAIDHSASQNNQSQFAYGNGRSGIAGRDNDEAGGQQGINKLIESIISSESEQSQGYGEDPVEEPSEETGATVEVKENE